MPSLRDSADYQEYMKLSTRPANLKPFEIDEQGKALLELDELFLEADKEINKKTAEELEASIISAADKIPIYAKEKLISKLNGTAARAAVKQLGYEVFLCDNCKNERGKSFI
ncbi:hypothetical protein GJ744_008932 [Endocarpon pusillum]|uniref:Uncharacterized protein n=1 Tax=Endocarpon pusillum TaxID=364733 RepID=A0A8H7AQR7_9EURO|nr:hypothetical protein GJ744_008932 [Endocarpon pusillum]